MIVNAFHRPTYRDALAYLEVALERGNMMTILGRYTVDCDGHVMSKLGPDNRLVVLRSDGPILVHIDEKRIPINWQPPGYTHSTSVRDGRLRVKSTRTGPDEYPGVRLGCVEQCSTYTASGRSDLKLVSSEGGLHRYVLLDPDVFESGFEPLEAERQNNAGAIDIFGEDAASVPIVVKLK